MMTDFQLFMVVWIGSAGIIFVVAVLVVLLFVISDRTIVFVLRAFSIRRFFKTAMQIAAITETDPDGWRCERYRATHKAIGTIVCIGGLEVETPQGTWKPNRIERRIIRNALDRMITAKVREHVAQAG